MAQFSALRRRYSWQRAVYAVIAESLDLTLRSTAQKCIAPEGTATPQSIVVYATRHMPLAWCDLSWRFNVAT